MIQDCSSSLSVQGSKKVTPTKKKPKRLFRKIWLDVKGFQPWLTYNKDDPTHRTYNTCKVQLGARFSTLVFHAKSQEHLRLSNQKEHPPSSDFILPAREDSKEEMTRVVRELRMMKMCTKLNLSYQKVPILLEELRDIDKNCIWNDIQIGEIKARNMVVNVMGEGSKEDIAAILRENYFCICIHGKKFSGLTQPQLLKQQRHRFL